MGFRCSGTGQHQDLPLPPAPRRLAPTCPSSSRPRVLLLKPTTCPPARTAPAWAQTRAGAAWGPGGPCPWGTVSPEGVSSLGNSEYSLLRINRCKKGAGWGGSSQLSRRLPGLGQSLKAKGQFCLLVVF